MTHYLKYTATLIFIALIACNGFAQERLEKAVKDNKQTKLTLGTKGLPALPDGNQLSLRLYLDNIRVVAEPVMNAYAAGLVSDATNHRFVKHSSAKYLSSKEANRLRNLQQLYFNGYHPYPMQWKELSSLTPRYRFSF